MGCRHVTLPVGWLKQVPLLRERQNLSQSAYVDDDDDDDGDDDDDDDDDVFFIPPTLSVSARRKIGEHLLHSWC